MPKLIMTKGLPASGKTTWAKEEVLKSGGRTKRVNKDDLRAMIDASQWSKQNENNILQVRDSIIIYYLLCGNDVIVDDTNFSPKHSKVLQQIAEKYAAEFEEKSFLDVPLATCIVRNAKRENPVPETTIKSMYNSFIRGKRHVAQYVPTPHNPDLPNCIIVDIDGTLAHMNGRSPFDYSKVGTDVVDPTVSDVVRRYAQRDIQDLPENYIIIVSGRDGACRAETEEWLKANYIPYDEFYMRTPDDNRDDTIVKREIYEEFIKPRYNVKFVLDDRDKVVKMWRGEGLKVLQVAEGDF